MKWLLMFQAGQDHEQYESLCQLILSLNVLSVSTDHYLLRDTTSQHLEIQETVGVMAICHTISNKVMLFITHAVIITKRPVRLRLTDVL